MAQENQHPVTPETNVEHDEVNDRGILDFLHKKEEEKPEEEISVPEFAKEHVIKSEEKKEEEENKHSFPETLPLSNTNGGSYSDEEGGEKKKTKGIAEKIKEKITGDKEEEKKDHEEVPPTITEKIRAKFPDTHKKTDEQSAPAPAPAPVEEKKGFVEKIKEKLPGHHKKEEQKEVKQIDGLTG